MKIEQITLAQAAIFQRVFIEKMKIIENIRPSEAAHYFLLRFGTDLSSFGLSRVKFSWIIGIFLKTKGNEVSDTGFFFITYPANWH